MFDDYGIVRCVLVWLSDGVVDAPDNGSDSESEDKDEEKKATLKLDDWVSFKLDPEVRTGQ